MLLAAGFGPHLNGPPNARTDWCELTTLNLIAGAWRFPCKSPQSFSSCRVSPASAWNRSASRGGSRPKLPQRARRLANPHANLSGAQLRHSRAVRERRSLQRQGTSARRIGQKGLSPGEWFLFIAAVTVTAPVMEEMVFRGALQTWLENRPLGGTFLDARACSRPCRG